LKVEIKMILQKNFLILIIFFRNVQIEYLLRMLRLSEHFLR